MTIVLSETWPREGQPINRECLHAQHTPAFSIEACRYLSREQIREKYPAFNSTCASCGQKCRIWASLEHLQALGSVTPP